jgi:hypothetical protein
VLVRLADDAAYQAPVAVLRLVLLIDWSASLMLAVTPLAHPAH